MRSNLRIGLRVAGAVAILIFAVLILIRGTQTASYLIAAVSGNSARRGCVLTWALITLPVWTRIGFTAVSRVTTTVRRRRGQPRKRPGGTRGWLFGAWFATLVPLFCFIPGRGSGSGDRLRRRVNAGSDGFAYAIEPGVYAGFLGIFGSLLLCVLVKSVLSRRLRARSELEGPLMLGVIAVVQLAAIIFTVHHKGF